MAKSDLEQTLLWQMKVSKVPMPESEYRFHPQRRWRFDFAWPDERLAVECEGGSWVDGAHNRGKHFEEDCEKYNTAIGLCGWKVLRFTNHMINDGRAVAMIQEVLGGLGG